MAKYSETYLRDKLTNQLQADYVTVEDFSDGCGMKFNVVVVSAQFEGKPLLQRHRMVNATLEEELKTIHAISQKTYTPQQWQQLNDKEQPS